MEECRGKEPGVPLGQCHDLSCDLDLYGYL